MSTLNKAQETKIALVIEGIEGLIAALHDGETSVNDARKELHDRLREFLLPAIRIIDGAEQQSGAGINVICQKCGRERQCLDHGIGGCPDWAASIKAYYTAEDSGGSVA